MMALKLCNNWKLRSIWNLKSIRAKVTNSKNNDNRMSLEEIVPAAKKAKLANGEEVENKQENIRDLSKFVFKRILSDFGQRKVISVEGTFSDRDGKAILWLEKTPFSEENVKSLLTENSVLKRLFINDIYGSYSCFADPTFNEIKTTVIHPATDQHIAKFLEKPKHLIEETSDYYQTITRPFLEKEQLSVQWVYNILEHKKEKERIVFEDDNKETGFILIPDLKWNAKQTEDLYLLALVHPRGLKSLRDLTKDHLPLLKNILNKGRKAIFEKYKIPPSQLRVYIHYQPSFYHLHVHFNYLSFDAPGILCEKSHLLSSVINNIELRSDYYQKATLSFVVKEGENLATEYLNRGIIKKIEPPVQNRN
ncbi:m7GpppX diphosphatase [Cimex lectularius]|uniref:m7GpppX diphosphatase n=1 Tax=Cimex lectularius TaxID=79782 RepID=A0A8I6RM60_CIMLE|nr:m7GpppX diphosphatase [Cimex lectularius]